jgi:hypothetical protein
MSSVGRNELFAALDSQTLGLLPWRKFFRDSQRWPYRKKVDLQLDLLRALSVEFGLGIASWKDFQSLKVTAKSDLRGYAPHNRELAIEYQTSGSSGVPFSFYRDRSLEAIDTGIFERAWSMVGRKDQLVLRLVSGTPKWAYYDSLRNVVPMNYRTIDDSYVEWVVSKKPFLIHGVAGAIRDLSQRIIAAGKAKHLKGIRLYLMSEDTRTHREALLPYFSGIFMGYGTSECRTVASQCRYGTLHVNMETSVAESVDGELVVTNLHNKVMPFVRYRTGDKGEVVKGKRCKCGVVSDVIEGLEGKTIDYYFEEGMKRPTGWWLVSPISHDYGDLVQAWRIEVVPPRRLVRVYAVPKATDLDRFQTYLDWIEQNLGFRAELVKVKELPDWRRRLLKVVKE